MVAKVIFLTLLSCAVAAPASESRQGKILPIFNNSPVGHIDADTGDFKITKMPQTGALDKKFKNFPLPWSVLMAPIPGVSGELIGKDNLVPVLESTHEDFGTLGYYFINPFGNSVPIPNLFGRNLNEREEPVMIESNGVKFSSNQIKNEQDLFEALLEEEMTEANIGNDKDSETSKLPQQTNSPSQAGFYFNAFPRPIRIPYTVPIRPTLPNFVSQQPIYVQPYRHTTNMISPFRKVQPAFPYLIGQPPFQVPRLSRRPSWYKRSLDAPVSQDSEKED